MTDRSRGQLRGLVRRLMHELEGEGLGASSQTDLRDTFKLNEDLPGIALVTTRPTAKNHIRSEDSSLLFRYAAPAFRDAAASVSAQRAGGKKDKGEDFLYSSLDPDSIRYLFDVVRQLVRTAASDAVSPSSTATADHGEKGGRQESRVSSQDGAVPPTLIYEFRSGDVDQGAPLIYTWSIMDPEGRLRYRYVGKSEPGARRPTRDYAKNVENLLAGRPYRPQKPDGFRVVHRRLADAARWGWPVVLTLIRNVQPHESILAVEAAYIAEIGCDDWPDDAPW